MSWHFAPSARFADFAADWDRLHGAAPMLASAFVAPLLSGRELIACYREDGQARTMLILERRAACVWATCQPPQAPLGLWVGAPRFDGLLAALPGLALLLGVTQCDPFLHPRPADGPQQRSVDYIETARVTVAGSFDDYWQARGKNLRANLKKQRARLQREGVATRLEVIGERALVAQAVADYGRLESAGWKAGQGTAVAADNAQGRFYTAMLEAFCDEGRARIYRYWIGERVAAMDLCIEEGECLVVLKTAYDEGAFEGLSPSLLMREEATRALFDEGRIARIEFYGRVMEWHRRWTNEVRTLYHLNHYRWPLLARLHALRRNHKEKS